MGYLTAEWEELNLQKKSDQALNAELKYLKDQAINKRILLSDYMGNLAYGIEGKMPLWMILSDIESVCAQTNRVVAEMKRRELP